MKPNAGNARPNRNVRRVSPGRPNALRGRTFAAAPDPVRVVPDFMGGFDLAVGGRLRSPLLCLPTELPPAVQERSGRLDALLDIE